MPTPSAIKISSMPPPPVVMGVMASATPRRTETSSAPAPGAAPLAALEIMQMKAQHTLEVEALTAERDAAVAENTTLQKEKSAHREQIAMEKRIAAEFSKKLSVAQKEARDLRAEHEKALARIEELNAQAAANAAAVQAAANAAEAPAMATPPPSEAQADWEARVTSRFEEDIANYRQRIQALLAEREALREENAGLKSKAS